MFCNFILCNFNNIILIFLIIQIRQDKKIIVGKNASMLKSIGIDARSDLEEYFNSIVQNYPQPYKDRVVEELKLYKEKGMEKFLRFCIYLSVVICEQDLVVGVGRGSSCSSLLLYLLQIHLIDPIQYGLDIKEFLK